jgi:hypothetical protein
VTFKNFINGSHTLAAVQADCEQTMNLYPEAVASDGGSPDVDYILVRSPGTVTTQTLADSPGRGKFSIDGRDFAVVGGSFYELLTAGATAVLRGSFFHGASTVKMECNTVQICIIADGLGYIFTLATNAFQQIASAGFPAYAVSLTSIDTYFIVLSQNTNQFSLCNPLDGLTWQGINFGSSQAPDNAVGVAQNHLYLWIFGQNTTVVFQDTGNSSFAFQRVPGSQIEMGCGGAATIVTIDNTLMWMGSSSRGPSVIYRADGFLPTRVSTHAVETAMQNYPRVDDASAYPYEERGHLFYRIDFPSANGGAGATWLQDMATAKWCERGYWNVATGLYSANRSRYHSFCFNKHLTLDYTNGNVYDQSLNYADESSNPLRWLRRCPYISSGQFWIFFTRFQLVMQVGDGLNGTGIGSNPQVFLRWSNDAGVSWSNRRMASSGVLGAFLQRVFWTRLGRARRRVWEVSGSDPVPNLTLIGVELELSKGTS